MSTELCIDILTQVGLLNDDNQALVTHHDNPEELAEALDSLQEAGLLTQDNFAVVALHFDPINMAAVLAKLVENELLTPANRDLVALHRDLQNGFELVLDLYQAELLTSANVNRLLAQTNIAACNMILACLDSAQLLNQANFDSLFAPNHSALLTTEASFLILQIPGHLLTAANFETLVLAAEHTEPREEIQRVVAAIIAEPQAPDTPVIMNDGQSTHTASVHRSVSAAAQKLHALYQAGLAFNDKLEELKTDILSQPSSAKNDAAKRALTRLFSSSFTDSSGVSLRQLLALAYVAIHDDSKRLGSLADAKGALIEGLYEIQRGYNLNEHGVDEGGADLPICWAGSFNKIIEKLNGVHQDVELNFITRATAAAKLPKLVAAKAQEYLQSIAPATTVTAARDLKWLLCCIDDEQSLAPIWDKIKAGVSDLLWEEFQEAFPGPQGPVDFAALIASGIDTPIPDLTAIGQQLRQSLGYRHYVEAQQPELTTHGFGLFAETGSREEGVRKRARTGKFDL